jgi:hypothetical protein
MESNKSDFQPKEQFRVVIDVVASESIGRMLQRINEGFSAGTVSRSQFANYLFTTFEKQLNEATIGEIRELYFDEMKALESLVRKASEGSPLPPEFREILLSHCGFDPKKKRAKKSQNEG